MNKQRALRLEPTTVNDAPNWLGGYGGNFADASAVGITIGGGGAKGEPNLADVYFAAVPRYDTSGGGADNRVHSSSYATVSGGRGNDILFDPASGRGFYETIAGGATNQIENSAYASIGGGGEHKISSHSDHSTIRGGQSSQVVESRWASIGGGLGHVQGFTPGGTIGGGITNRMTPFGGLQVAYAPTIGGGQENWIFASSYATIAGGYSNNVLPFSESATIGGGDRNSIEHLSSAATISGGRANIIQFDSPEGVIGGGGTNVIERNSPAATIAGERLNYIDHGSEGATISGGQSNRLNFFTEYSTIAGGTLNEIGFFTGRSVIGGGELNDIGDYSNLATIGGGGENKVGAEILAATIGGGRYNNIDARSDYSFIGGGVANHIEAITPSSTIAGGSDNVIVFAPNDAVNTIGGGHRNKIRRGEYATIPGGRDAYARRYGQLAHASGSFANAGDAQRSVHILRGTSSGTVPQELFLDGSSKLLDIPIDSTWAFEVQVAARSQTGDAAGYQVSGVIKNVGGTTTLVGTTLMPLVREDVAAWNVFVTADNANSSLSIKVLGGLSTSVRWVATVRTTEVMFP